MNINFHAAIALTGGGIGALDRRDGDILNDEDAALVIIPAGGVYMYTLDATSGAAESVPDVIEPDTNPGTKRWILRSQSAGSRSREILVPLGSDLPYADGSDNAGYSEATHDQTNHRNYIEWKGGAADQDLDFVYEFILPPDFLSWADTIAFYIDVWSDDYTNHILTVSLYDASGNVDPGIDAVSIIPTADNTWQTKTLLPEASYSPDDWVHFHVHCDVDTSGDLLRIARMYFKYLT